MGLRTEYLQELRPVTGGVQGAGVPVIVLYLKESMAVQLSRIAVDVSPSYVVPAQGQECPSA